MTDLEYHESSPREDTQPQPPVDPRRSRPPQESRGGCGCWLPALLTLALVAVLVGIGLFLPPISLYDRLFGPQYAMLDAQSNAVASSGLTLVVDPADTGAGFGVALNAVTPQTASPEAQEALNRVPGVLALQSPLYDIQTTGNAPAALTLSVGVPAGAANPDLLDVYGYDRATGAWRFVPAQFDGAGALVASVADIPDQLAVFQAMPTGQATVLVAVDVTETLTPEVAEVATIVAPAGLQPNLEGELVGSLAAGFDQNAAYSVMPAIRNFIDARALDPQTVTVILGNSGLAAQHVANLAAFASTGYDGLLIDYRDLPAESRDQFSAFVQALGARFDELGLSLGVVVPAAQNIDGRWDTGAYDWKRIGQAADLVVIDLGYDPSAFTPGPDRLVEAMLRWGVGEISRDKLLLGLSAQSVRQVGGTYTPVTYDEALSGLGDVEIEAETTEAGVVNPGTEIRARLDGFAAAAGSETALQAPYIDYLDDGGATVARVWLTTPGALRFRMDRTLPFSLRGVAFDDLVGPNLPDGILQTIGEYRRQLPFAPSLAEYALRWRIENAAGVIGEVTTGLGEGLVTTIEAPEGNYAINVDVVGGARDVPRSGAAVAVFAPTPTPTPRPTETPEPSPTPTPTPAAVAQAPAPEQAAPAQPAAPAAAPAAGSIVAGSFEYGGHVTTAATGAAEQMRRAGMNWMKVQLVYSPGMDPGVASGPISDARGRGFKILLGIVGRPADLASGGAGYISQYASFLGGVAALGPDAIEVWNEPNLDREWPTGQISGAGYVEVLRQAYGAIKGSNGSVMVISGAPAPTGAEGAFPGQVMNDDRWLREVVNAGGLQYMDCVGAHYNEGIIGPSQRGGDPRDGYYTRYFWGMIDTYWAIVGGQRPLCFTELGYLTPEGYPPLPGFFSWAQNVTLSQQAAWLAEAAALASQSGKVRLMIVWNIDFTVYGADPQAGYAIIRADGRCPACDALASAR